MKIDLKETQHEDGYEQIYIDGLYEGLVEKQTEGYSAYLKFRVWDRNKVYPSKEELIEAVKQVKPFIEY